MLTVGVRMQDGSFRKYDIDLHPSEGYDKIIALVKKEVLGATRALVIVPRKEKYKFSVPEGLSA
jgi:hypothetical protein